MHDSAAALAEPGATATLGAARVVAREPGEAAAGVSLPVLLDMRLVRAELARLRAPRMAKAVDRRRAGGTQTGSAADVGRSG
jgi:mannose/fructose-specific phosphotransferase system component IIA